MKKLILPLISLLILLPNIYARFWTNKEGKSFEGELVEVKDNAVTIRRTRDRIKFTVNAADLSQGDQDYLKELAEEKKAEAEAKKEKPKSSKDKLPTSEKQLAKWLVGTVWLATQYGVKGNSVETNLRRFDKDGVQSKKPARGDKFTPYCKYIVLNSNTIQYGLRKYTVKFDSEYLTFEGKSDKGARTIKGKRIVEMFSQSR